MMKTLIASIIFSLLAVGAQAEQETRHFESRAQIRYNSYHSKGLVKPRLTDLQKAQTILALLERCEQFGENPDLKDQVRELLSSRTETATANLSILHDFRPGERMCAMLEEIAAKVMEEME